MLDTTLTIDPQLDAHLRSATIAWMGTVRPDGGPHTVPVWFYWDGEAFLIFAQPNDQKLRNLRHSPKVTLGVPINPEASSVAIVHGEAEVLHRSADEALPAEYVAKYREHIDAYGWGDLGMAAQYSAPIRLRPTRLTAW